MRCLVKTAPNNLVKMLYGVLSPDQGRFTGMGRLNRLESGSCHGHCHVLPAFSLFPALTVAENIALALDDAPLLADKPAH